MELLTWIDGTDFAESIRSSLWLFPALETVHVIAIALVVGSIAVVDMRLAGLAGRNRPISQISHEMLPWTWVAFGIATIVGVLLFVGTPVKYVGIAFFDIKMVLIALAGANMLVFEYMTSKSIADWDRAPTPPAAVRLTGMLSLAFWVSVIICGRFIGFV
jgi:Family of unknown function (DUF6644)